MTGRVLLATGFLGLVPLVAGCSLMAPPWALPAADSQYARIVVYRPGGLTGFARQFMLTLDGRQQAWIVNGRYFVMDVMPGAHTLALEDAGAGQRVDARPAQAHYLRLRVVKLADGLTANLEAVAPETAHRELAELEKAEAYVPQEEPLYTPAGGPRS